MIYKPENFINTETHEFEVAKALINLSRDFRSIATAITDIHNGIVGTSAETETEREQAPMKFAAVTGMLNINRALPDIARAIYTLNETLLNDIDETKC